jgi:hypothetical protein
MSNVKTYVEYKGRMMASRYSAITRTPHIKEVPIQLVKLPPLQ